MEAETLIPDANGDGWDYVDNCYKVHWIDNKPAPDEIVDLVACNCKISKCVDDCQCVQLEVPCTEICNCKNDCGNNTEDENEFFSDEEIMSDSSDEFEDEITEDELCIFIVEFLKLDIIYMTKV